jgi:hypothetical protein
MPKGPFDVPDESRWIMEVISAPAGFESPLMLASTTTNPRKFVMLDLDLRVLRTGTFSQIGADCLRNRIYELEIDHEETLLEEVFDALQTMNPVQPNLLTWQRSELLFRGALCR